jgi:hypothetical protein
MCHESVLARGAGQSKSWKRHAGKFSDNGSGVVSGCAGGRHRAAAGHGRFCRRCMRTTTSFKAPCRPPGAAMAPCRCSMQSLYLFFIHHYCHYTPMQATVGLGALYQHFYDSLPVRPILAPSILLKQYYVRKTTL